MTLLYRLELAEFAYQFLVLVDECLRGRAEPKIVARNGVSVIPTLIKQCSRVFEKNTVYLLLLMRCFDESRRHHNHENYPQSKD